MRELTAVDMFEQRVSTDPDGVFVITPDGRERTYADINREVGRLASVLSGAGVRRGDPVLLHLWNDPAWVVATFACWRLGAATVACGGQSPAVEAARRAELTGARIVVGADDLPAIGDLTRIQVDGEGRTTSSTGSGGGDTEPAAEGGGQDRAAVFFTSGTTGEPKAVNLTHAAIAAAPRSTAGAYSKSPDFRTRTASSDAAPAVSFNPFGHLATLGRVIFRMYVGRPVVLVRKFDALTMQTLAERYAFDTLQLTPAMIHTLAHTDLDLTLGSLRYVTAGTAALSLATRDAFEARFAVPVLVAYGSTEGSVTALERYDDVRAGRRGPGSVGRVADGIEFRIADPAGRDVEPNAVGELLGRPRDGRDLTVDADGWHHTGDLARLDDNGILFITGRLSDRMIVGGFNVEPGQIEDVLRSHPAVRDAIVVAIQDERLGDMPIGGIVFADAPVSASALESLCRASLEAYKVPRLWYRLDEMPMTVGGKPHRTAAVVEVGEPISR